MGKLTMTAFLSVDGVMQAPGGPDEDRSGGFVHGGWVAPFVDEAMVRLVEENFAEADAFLLGRRTYEIFASHWPRVTDPEDRIAAALNRLPKHVVSRTLPRAEWAGASLVRGDVPKEIAALKERYARELQVHGSIGLAQTLLENELVDVFHLWTYPVVLGSGRRLFGSGTIPLGLAHVRTRTTAGGVVVSTYRREGKPRYGAIGLET